MTLVLATLSTLNLWWALVSTPSSEGILCGCNQPSVTIGNQKVSYKDSRNKIQWQRIFTQQARGF